MAPAPQWLTNDFFKDTFFREFQLRKRDGQLRVPHRDRGEQGHALQRLWERCEGIAKRLPVDVEAATTTFDVEVQPAPARSIAVRSEWPQTRKRNHPRPRLMDTSRIDGVNAPLHDGTPRYARHDVAFAVFRTVVVELAVMTFLGRRAEAQAVLVRAQI